MRKNLHNVNQDADLPDADVKFLNEVTPNSVVVAKKESKAQECFDSESREVT